MFLLTHIQLYISVHAKHYAKQVNNHLTTTTPQLKDMLIDKIALSYKSSLLASVFILRINKSG